MENVILVAILALIVFGAAFYVFRAKKRGQKCVGCPYSKKCGSEKCNCNTPK